MENQTNSNQDCGCGGDGCCTPKKKGNIWTKLIFIAIIVAALVIITIKLTGKNENTPAMTNDTLTTKNAGCTDSTAKSSCAKSCDTSKSSSCCPNSGK